MRITTSLTVIVLLVTFGACFAVAQSSGNFSAAGSNTVCALDTSTGNLSPACGTPADGEQCLALSAPIKLSSGNGVTLLVTPSVVTGLFTDTKISTTISKSNADIGIKVCLSVDDGKTEGVSILPATDDGCVVYDQRFQQISSQLFSQLTECTAFNSGTACTPTADDCSTSVGPGFTCSPTTATCVGPNPSCDFDLILSTLSAHSFNFVVTVPKGQHTINAVWKLTGVSTSGQSSVAACTGPGDLTLTQVKVFNNSGAIDFP